MGVRLLDLMDFIESVEWAVRDPGTGWADADRAHTAMLEILNRHVKLKKDVLESALWACKMREESTGWKLTNGMTVEEYANSLAQDGEEYDPFYCHFVPKKEKSDETC